MMKKLLAEVVVVVVVVVVVGAVLDLEVGAVAVVVISVAASSGRPEEEVRHFQAFALWDVLHLTRSLPMYL